MARCFHALFATLLTAGTLIHCSTSSAPRSDAGHTVITKTAEVLAKHLREKIKAEPEVSAQVLRTWINEDDDA